MSEEQPWVRRFTAPELGFPVWSATDPDVLALVTTLGGAAQVWTHDLRTGAWQQLSHESIGVDQEVWALPDGRFAWWSDGTGNERGRLVGTPVGGSAEPIVADLPEGWLTGLAFHPDRTALGVEVEGDFRVYAIDTEDAPRLLWATRFPNGVGRTYPKTGGLSVDGSLVCVRHAERADILHLALRVLDAGTGAVQGDLVDAGSNLEPDAWSPVPGDQRLAFTSELGPFERPAIWDVGAGERTDLAVDLPGAVFPIQWWPDASALLVRHEHEGRAQLYRLDPSSVAIDLIADPHGDIESDGGAAIRPDGSVGLLASDATRAPRVVDQDGRDVLPSRADASPPGRPFRSFVFSKPERRPDPRVRGDPAGAGTVPDRDVGARRSRMARTRSLRPETQAFVDAG